MAVILSEICGVREIILFFIQNRGGDIIFAQILWNCFRINTWMVFLDAVEANYTGFTVRSARYNKVLGMLKIAGYSSNSIDTIPTVINQGFFYLDKLFFAYFKAVCFGFCDRSCFTQVSL